ncbi:MAG: GAF domain-containing protein [Terriglobales bacterium]
MQGSPHPDDRFPSSNAIAGALEESELESALQLLVERAQYITGATGTALALPHGDEMVCRASAGSCAPAVGARLQVRSGLTGESITRRQLLRCNNAETDPRVNLETCRALGIASIVVLPLLRQDGEVRGLFELFSDHPYAFEERDLIALERMADLTLTALDLAERRPRSEPAAELEPAPEMLAEAAVASGTPEAAEVAANERLAEFSVPAEPLAASPETTIAAELSPTPLAVASVPEAMRRVQKCEVCGFPVSAGRTLCLDCEKRDREKKDAEKKDFDTKQREREHREFAPGEPGQGATSGGPAPEEFVPAFLAKPATESWLARHANLLAIVILLVGIVVAVAVFR